MNIAEILKNVPKGTKLYSPAFGEVIFKKVIGDNILVNDICDIERTFSLDGKFYKDGECMLFPSRENRDWNTFKKFDITTLKPFDKVLCRDYDNEAWKCDIFSHSFVDNRKLKFRCIGTYWLNCIPYNDETKHLVGTDEDCPEYYKTW
jgi:hypothetical protein